MGKTNELAVDGAAENPPRNFHVPKTRKYPCCIRILRERVKNKGQVPLVLLIKGRQVEASQKLVALLACLHENQGRVVSYKQLNLILGHRVRMDFLARTRPRAREIISEFPLEMP